MAEKATLSERHKELLVRHAGSSVEDDYDRLRDDVEFRKQVVEKVGLGFELPASLVPIVRNPRLDANKKLL